MAKKKKLDDLNREHPILEAAKQGNLDVLRLLSEGCPVDYCDAYGSTPLMRAAAHGRLEIVDVLIGADCDIEARNKDGETALMAAALYAKKECVGRLLAAGGCVDAKSNSGLSVLMKAVLGFLHAHDPDDDAKGCFSLVLAAGCGLDEKQEWGETAWDIACERGLEWAMEAIETERERRALLLETGEAPSVHSVSSLRI